MRLSPSMAYHMPIKPVSDGTRIARPSSRVSHHGEVMAIMMITVITKATIAQIHQSIFDG